MDGAVYFFIDYPWRIAAVALFFGAALAVAIMRPVRFPTVVACGLVILAGGVGFLVGVTIDLNLGTIAECYSLPCLTQGPIFGYLAGLAVLVKSQRHTFRNGVSAPPPADPSAGETTISAGQSALSRQPDPTGYSLGECLTTVGLLWWTLGSALIWVCGAAAGALLGSQKFTVLAIMTHQFSRGLFCTESYDYTLRTPAAMIAGGEITCAVILLMLCSRGPWRDGFLRAALRFRMRRGWNRRQGAAPRFNFVPLVTFPIGLVCLFFGAYLGVNFVSGSRLTPGERLLKSTLLASGVSFLGLSCLATNLALLRNERWAGLTAVGVCLNAIPILGLVAAPESFEAVGAVIGCVAGSLFIWLFVRWVNRRASDSRAF